jgi:hypothetical protein
MNRQAILLAASPDDEPIPGVYADLAAFYSFLQSNHGGAWDTKEIFRGENSARNQILSAINAAKNADYSLVFFAGHGEAVKMGLPWLETRMLLSSGETITERELNSGSPRCTLILDCCRRTPEQNKEMFLINASILLERGEGSSDFRNFYEKNLSAAESGLVKVYATATGSAAADKHSFTQHLLNESYMWATRNKGTLDLGDAVALAKNAMKRENPQQRPEYQGGRRLRHFPFAVQI